MKKIKFINLVVLILTLGFFACKKDNDTTSNPNSEMNIIAQSNFSTSSVSDDDINAFLDNFDEDTVNTDSVAQILDMDMRSYLSKYYYI